MLYIYPMCGIFHLPSIDTGTRDRQFNISSERHVAGIFADEGQWIILCSPPGDQTRDILYSRQTYQPDHTAIYYYIDGK